MQGRMRITAGLVLVNILFYIFLAYRSNNFLQIDDSLMMKYGLYASGSYYQLVTNMFAHFDISHLGYNMVFLLIFGARAEEIYGGKILAALYLVCGAFASLISVLVHPLGTVSAGASGAIFGILGAVLVAQRNIYPSGLKTSLIYGFVFFALAAATGFLAHLVGLVLGFLIGYSITRDWYPEDEKESFWNNCRRV